MADLLQHQLPDTLTALIEKLAIALLALLAPEFIFVWALRQWLRARSIAEECQAAADTETAKEGRKRRSATNSTLTVDEQRTQLDYLEGLGFRDRTTGQDFRVEHLRERVERADKENAEPSVVVSGDDQTSELRLNVHRGYLIIYSV